MESITTKVSANLITGSMRLPGRVGNPLTLIRNYHQFKSSYTYKWESGFSFKWEDSFYSIDDIETNYATIGLLYDNQDFSYNTEIERYDSFGEKDSLMSFYQGVLFQGEKFKVGGGLKKIEGNNLKFLPKFKFDLTPNLIFSLDTSYKIPNLWSEIILYNYKKIDKPQLSPEEEYELNLAWSKEIESRNLNLYLSQTYIKNGYLWADINKNGFLEPISKEYWKTCLGCDIKQRVLKNFTLFLKGEREFFDKDIYYYPEIKLDTGFILGDNNISLKAWVSHIGKRKFVDENLKPYTLFNVELKLNQKEKIQWIVGVSNICGQKYFVSPGYPAEERKFYGVVKLYF
jgi:hypothetical protein